MPKPKSTPKVPAVAPKAKTKTPKVIPEAPRDLVLELSRRYISLFEMITWNQFDFTADREEGIAKAIKSFQK